MSVAAEYERLFILTAINSNGSKPSATADSVKLAVSVSRGGRG